MSWVVGTYLTTFFLFFSFFFLFFFFFLVVEGGVVGVELECFRQLIFPRDTLQNRLHSRVMYVCTCTCTYHVRQPNIMLGWVS